MCPREAGSFFRAYDVRYGKIAAGPIQKVKTRRLPRGKEEARLGLAGVLD